MHGHSGGNTNSVVLGLSQATSWDLYLCRGKWQTILSKTFVFEQIQTLSFIDCMEMAHLGNVDDSWPMILLFRTKEKRGGEMEDANHIFSKMCFTVHIVDCSGRNTTKAPDCS